MKEEILYKCEICGKSYRNKSDCLECELRGEEKEIVKVGDIVSMNYGCGWFNGDKRWVINPEVMDKPQNPKHGNCFGKCCTMGFYYVVTAIDKDTDDGHRKKYHVLTKAMSDKKNIKERGHRGGFTFSQYHITPKIIKNPSKFIVKDSKDLIGKKTKYLF